jgi:hypothetical protein
MAKRTRSPLPQADLLSAPRRKALPFPFVLEALDSAAPVTRPLFSCIAVYIGARIVFALRDRSTHVSDNGLWIATTQEHHASLLREFPHMRSIGVLGKPVTGWQLLPADAPDFESAALHACELVLQHDARIGKIPAAKRTKSSRPRNAK